VEGVMRVPCTIMRGGTSKALFFKASDVPEAGASRDEMIMAAMGSGDPRQVDGLGGADVLTSKVAVVGPPSRPDADIDYTFGQVGVQKRDIDWSGNCGNISSAVPVFAIQEQMVSAVEPLTEVRVHNTNTGKVLKLKVQVENGLPLVDGEFRVAGVPGTGAEIILDFSNTVGAMTGTLLPTGSVRDELYVPGLNRSISVSIVDVANAAVFFRAEDVGLTGSEGPEAFTTDILQSFLEIQLAAAELSGISPTHGFPRPVAVAPPQAFVDFMTGNVVAESEVDLLGRRVILPPPRLHKAFAGTGAVCVGVSARLAGTVVNEVTRDRNDGVVRLGHPTGVFPIGVRVDGQEVKEVSFSRTARRLMDGEVLVRVSASVPTGQ
jgi:2-methylaconitate cis-trans-isomerase PrpF